MARTSVLHLLSQRPSQTGSGVTLEALVERAAECGWEQTVVVGVPAAQAAPAIGALPATSVRPLVFDSPALPFAVPGMSDVMPYPSTRFSAMTAAQLGDYRAAFCDHLTAIIDEVRPDVIHAHHLWLLSAMVKDVAPRVPVVVHCHGTGLRQLHKCPQLADAVIEGCRRCERFVVLHGEHAEDLARTLVVGAERITVVGAGYREAVFHDAGRAAGAGRRLVYVGKLSPAKGLPQLLDAVERLAPELAGLELHVAGSGAGPEAAALERRLAQMAPTVRYHGQLDQMSLAALFRHGDVCVLPSFYEGLPLVLVEALACGCRLVATRLPGVVDQLAPLLGDSLTLVDPPRRIAVDEPIAADLPAFVDALAHALRGALAEGPVDTTWRAHAAEHFGWGAVFGRIERVWRAAIEAAG